MSSTIDSKAIANQKVELALKYIEQAQYLLSKACGELCPIVNASEQWKIVGDHYDATKDLWHNVNESILWSKIDLDPDEKRRLEEASVKNGMAVQS